MCTTPNTWLGLPASLAFLMITPLASAQRQKPSIPFIMGDDIGYWNIRAYNRGTERQYPDLEGRRS